MSLKSSIKGWFGELKTTVVKKVFLNANTYIDLNNVTIPTTIDTTQIDHVVVSRYGIFVIETKNMSGYIFGNERDSHWTQTFSQQKHKFQNPLRQNYRHTKALSEFLEISHDNFFSVIVFWGSCEFKTPMPSNVRKSGYVDYIKSKTDVLFSDEAVKMMVEAIKTGRLPRNRATHKAHVASLQERFDQPKICPQCGGQLILRTSTSGRYANPQFYGCKGYPVCRYTQQLELSS